jgi:hypothetical protein
MTRLVEELKKHVVGKENMMEECLYSQNAEVTVIY